MSVTAEPRSPSTQRTAYRVPTTTGHSVPSPLRRLIGGAFIAAPLLLLTGSIAFAAGSDAARAVLQFYAFALFLLVIVTLTEAIAPTFPRAATALTLLGTLGMAAGIGFGVDNLHGTLLDDAYLVDDGGIAGFLVANIPGLMGPLAFIGIGLALMRSGVQPRFTGAALIAAGLLFPVSRIGDIAPLAVVDDAVFLLALAPLGWAIIQGRNPIGRTR